MKKRKPIIGNKKLRGEWAELVFMVRAAEHGLPICKPWGEMRSYDFVVGWPGHFVAVQVKSTICEQGSGYECCVRGGHTSYAAGSFDFLAAYAVFDDAWYIIPAGIIQGMEGVSLYPKFKEAKYEKYREAWHLLDPDAKGGKIEINACVEEFPGEWVEPGRNRLAVEAFAWFVRHFFQAGPVFLSRRVSG